MRYRPRSQFIGRPTDVYRLYNTEGSLLYVGISGNGYARLETHRREKVWWPDAHRVVMTRYGDRHTALYVEACAIRDEHPVHNGTANHRTTLAGVHGNYVPIETDEFEVA